MLWKCQEAAGRFLPTDYVMPTWGRGRGLKLGGDGDHDLILDGERKATLTVLDDATTYYVARDEWEAFELARTSPVEDGATDTSDENRQLFGEISELMGSF